VAKAELCYHATAFISSDGQLKYFKMILGYSRVYCDSRNINQHQYRPCHYHQAVLNCGLTLLILPVKIVGLLIFQTKVKYCRWQTPVEAAEPARQTQG